MLNWLRQWMLARARRRAASLFPWLDDDSLAEQSVPDVSSSDVLRIIERDFTEADRQTVFNELTACPSINEPRLQLAILKLAAGDKGRIPTLIRRADFDFREILGEAENPEYDGMDFDDVMKLPGNVTKAVVSRDRQQYEAWLHGNSTRGGDQSSVE